MVTVPFLKRTVRVSPKVLSEVSEKPFLVNCADKEAKTRSDRSGLLRVSVTILRAVSFAVLMISLFGAVGMSDGTPAGSGVGASLVG